jgi:hypothetical protein
LEKLNEEKTVETRYFIASITEVKVFAVSARGRWQVDFTFKDDQNTTMRKHGAQNLQTMERVPLAILSLVQSYYDNRSLKGIRFTLSQPFRLIILIGYPFYKIS